MKQGKYICIEGVDGTGKSTQSHLLSERIPNSIKTSEPGNINCPIMMEIRKLVLDAQYDKSMTPLARDYLFQAARSINLEHIVYPNIKNGTHVISDRGAMSGFAYSLATGMDIETLKNLFRLTTQDFANKSKNEGVYDMIIVLENEDTQSVLDRAGEKKEFVKGDAIEMRGAKYMDQVRHYMRQMKNENIFKCPIVYIDVKDKTREQVNDEIYKAVVDIL